MAEEANVPVTALRGVSLGDGKDVYPGEKVLVTPRQAQWLLSGDQPYAVAGWDTTREEGAGAGDKKGKK